MKQENKKAKCLAAFGTGSDVGKSVIATALCRIFSDKGYAVSPYKAQNMSNNSGVTPEGLEMGRAQIVQAEAARVPPHVDMNPVLLKPVTQIGSQVVLLGKVLQDFSAVQYHKEKARLFDAACQALDRLRAENDVVVMEGAGSCAEVNLMARDIVNLKMAAYADAPVILTADIDRGGVFAQIVGTLACLEKEQQDQIAGFIINRFRGDITLFKDGVDWIQKKTGKRVFGVLPWFDHFHIQSEDSVVIEHPEAKTDPSKTPTVLVVRIPHISNFTDFDPLFQVKGLGVDFVERVRDLTPYKAVILPGSKSTRNDLDWLEQTGWTAKIREYVQSGGRVLGVCGGYQMLGKEVQDPGGLEGKPGATEGLGLLPHVTVLKAPKTTTLSNFEWDGVSGAGYEIHMGQTALPEDLNSGKERSQGLFKVLDRNQQACQDYDGAMSDNGRVMGTYMHGLFDSPAVLKKWLKSLGLEGLEITEESGMQARDRQYDMLARHFEKHVDVDALIKEAME
ncbi:adenosylcobyric acid synthase (glutamine-hydrolysing) [Desulfatibacillum alkenivorans DSM 16219]|jgi:adenosylcobyric acid synthase|uniref:Cobyric acid synthase n=1 Tax=Desulfatibacillum alkenivorans DSM 16219 TaxID=1121393 RepID=A0A1M6UAB6_9BACT|nr:cobyric acid synthase [Desulfatibacillum alkenivorans]SHK66101.1 adenosylcobyric acid synthase (glutamine-hydrolysing) [Desulfatibacillum alkenivorans DSM 16219]